MSNEKEIIKRVLSGVQPTGGLHLGNYLGAIKNFVPLQDKYQSLFCVVDLHAITVWQEPEELAAKKCEVAAAFIASIGHSGSHTPQSIHSSGLITSIFSPS